MKKIALLSVCLFIYITAKSQFDIDGNYSISGNLGIGLTTPAAKLHILQNANDLTGGIAIQSTGNEKAFIYRESDEDDALILRNNGINTLFIENGKVGLGLASPDYNLDVIGNTRINNLGFGNIISLRASNVSTTSYNFKLGTNGTHSFLGIIPSNQTTYSMTFLSDGNIGIGTTTPEYKLDIIGNTRINNLDFGNVLSFRASNKSTVSFDYYVQTNGTRSFLGLKPSNQSDYSMTFLSNGNIGIGTTSPGYKLDVIGTIRAREVKVDLNGADFVFEDDYKLRTLEEVESFVKDNKHLPEIVSADEMKANGTDLGELNTKLLQKIEELTLYMIEMNKKVNYLESENISLKDEIKELKNGGLK